MLARSHGHFGEAANASSAHGVDGAKPEGLREQDFSAGIIPQINLQVNKKSENG